MITITKEISIEQFDAWNGAVDTLDNVRNAGKLDELDALAEEVFPDGCTDTELNDWLWFDTDFIYDSLGLTEDGEVPNEEDEEDDNGE